MVLETEQFSSSSIVAKSIRKNVKLVNLTVKEKFLEKEFKLFLKLLQAKRNFISSLSNSSAKYNLNLW